MNDDKRERAATPPDVLEAELMSFSAPKSEREWYAMRVITTLRERVAELERESGILGSSATALGEQWRKAAETIAQRDAEISALRIERGMLEDGAVARDAEITRLTDLAESRARTINVLETAVKLRYSTRQSEDDDAEIGEEVERLRQQVQELEALKRPPMVRELPEHEGGFHYIPDEGTTPGQPYIIVIERNDGQLVDSSGTPIAEYYPGYWSARPIEMDELPEGGEG